VLLLLPIARKVLITFTFPSPQLGTGKVGKSASKGANSAKRIGWHSRKLASHFSS